MGTDVNAPAPLKAALHLFQEIILEKTAHKIYCKLEVCSNEIK